jgi:hypothetical protein
MRTMIDFSFCRRDYNSAHQLLYATIDGLYPIRDSTLRIKATLSNEVNGSHISTQRIR